MSVEVVLIGDVIKSREKFDPAEWEHFHTSINTINKEFASAFKIPLTVYSGDSFGGICDTVNSAVSIILAIQEHQQPHKSRIVLIEDEVSYGLSSTSLDSESFLTLEGPALWKSQPQMDMLKKSKSFFLANLTNELKTLSVNTILNLILSIRNSWSEIEWEVYKRSGSDITQQEMADQLDVTQQYISKITRSSQLKLIKEAEKNLTLILDGIDHLIH